VQRVGNPCVTHQCRQPEGDRILAHDHTEVDRRQQPQAPVADELADRGVGDLLLVVFGQFASDQGFFVVIEPGRLMHAVLQITQHQQADDHGGHRLENEHPLPAGPAVHAGKVVHDPTGQRATDHA